MPRDEGERGRGGEGGHGDPHALSPSRPLPSSVRLFAATSFANDLASEIIYPLLPALVTRTLGGGAFALGLLDGIAEAVASVFKLVSGYLAERPRWRAPLVVGGYAVAALVRPLIALAGAAWHVVALRAVDRLGKGARTAPRDVLIAGAVPNELRGRAFGLHRAADHAGAVLGPLIAAGLLLGGWTVPQVIWAAVVPGLAAVGLAWWAVRAAATGDQPMAAVPRSPGPSVPRSSITLLLLATATAIRLPETLLILRAQHLGVEVVAIPLLWSGLHVVRSLASVPGGTLADRWGPRRTIAVGWSAYAVLALAFARADGPLQAMLVFTALGLVAAFTESPERKLVASLTGGERHGRAFGWYHGLTGAMALPGAAVLGWVYQVHGAWAALHWSAAGAAAVLGLWAALAARRS